MTCPTAKLGDIVDVLSGFAFKSEFFSDENGFPIIRIRDVVRGYTDTFYAGPFTEPFIVQNGEIIIGMDGNFNAAKWQGGPALLNQRVCKVTAKAQLVDEDYLFHYLPIVLKKVEDATPFVTVKHLSVKDLKDEIIPLPSLAEQRRIAAILDKVDALCAKRREALAQLDRLAQSIFVEMFGDPMTNEKKWNTQRLDLICEVGSSKRVYVEELTEKGIPFFRGTEIGALGEGKEVKPTLFISKEHYLRLKAEAGIPNRGDLLLPSICPDGRIFLVDTDEPFYFKDARVLWIKVQQHKISGIYLMHYLKLVFAKDYSKIASGTTFAELKIFSLKQLAVIFPPLEMQRRFEKLVQSIEKQAVKSKRSHLELSKLFSSLQQRAFRREL